MNKRKITNLEKRFLKLRKAKKGVSVALFEGPEGVYDKNKKLLSEEDLNTIEKECALTGTQIVLVRWFGHSRDKIYE